MQNKAVVVGALGVIGRYISERLVLAESDWQVVGLSRRKAPNGQRYQHIAVDLLDVEDTRRKLAEVMDVTHVFYAAFQATPEAHRTSHPIRCRNRDMLVNSVTAITRASPRLKRVVLVTGTKYYGVHLGPLKTPMRETDPRHTGPNYYFDQIDWLTAYQRGKKWDWVELRPQTLCGFSPGSPMSILPAIAVYTAISKELCLPLRFPGKLGADDFDLSGDRVNAFCQCSAVGCNGSAMRKSSLQHYAMVTISAGGTYGPEIAAVFDMSVADPQTISLTQHMADKGPRWEEMTAKYKLKASRLH